MNNNIILKAKPRMMEFQNKVIRRDVTNWKTLYKQLVLVTWCKYKYNHTRFKYTTNYDGTFDLVVYYGNGLKQEFVNIPDDWYYNI